MLLFGRLPAVKSVSAVKFLGITSRPGFGRHAVAALAALRLKLMGSARFMGPEDISFGATKDPSLCWPVYFWIRHEVMQGSHLDPVVVVLGFAPFGPLQFLLYGVQTWFFPFVRLAYEPEWSVWFSLPRVLGALCILTVLAGTGLRRRHPTGRVLLFWLIWIGLFMLGDTRAARDAFEEALRLEPDHPEAKQNLQRHFE